MFYAADRVTKKLINIVKTSLFDFDKVFVKLCKESENNKNRCSDENDQPNLPLKHILIQR